METVYHNMKKENKHDEDKILCVCVCLCVQSSFEEANTVIPMPSIRKLKMNKVKFILLEFQPPVCVVMKPTFLTP